MMLAKVQSGGRRLQAFSELPSQASLSAVIQGFPMMPPVRVRPNEPRRKIVWENGTASLALILLLAAGGRAHAQIPAPETAARLVSAAAATPSTDAPAADDYIIGSDDVLSILFWKDKDLSTPEVTVRPDGKV